MIWCSYVYFHSLLFAFACNGIHALSKLPRSGGASVTYSMNDEMKESANIRYQKVVSLHDEQFGSVEDDIKIFVRLNPKLKSNSFSKTIINIPKLHNKVKRETSKENLTVLSTYANDTLIPTPITSSPAKKKQEFESLHKPRNSKTASLIFSNFTDHLPSSKRIKNVRNQMNTQRFNVSQILQNKKNESDNKVLSALSQNLPVDPQIQNLIAITSAFGSLGLTINTILENFEQQIQALLSTVANVTLFNKAENNHTISTANAVSTTVPSASANSKILKGSESCDSSKETDKKESLLLNLKIVPNSNWGAQTLVPRVSNVLGHTKAYAIHPFFRHNEGTRGAKSPGSEINYQNEDNGEESPLKTEHSANQLALSRKGNKTQTEYDEIRYDETCHCGISKRPRIINGALTNVVDHPWIVQLINSDDIILCGGTILTEDFILTAAHCLVGMEPKELRIRVGHTSSKLPGTTVGIEDIISHRGFKMWTLEHNDIALLKTKNPLSFSNTIQPICLPEFEEDLEGEEGIIAGWGIYDDSGDVSDVLREQTVTIYEKDSCRKISGYIDIEIPRTAICALRPSVDACQGDSGGPLSIERNGIQIQVGITSWGIDCATSKYPGVYTKVSQYYTWIRKRIKRSRHCLIPALRKSENKKILR